MKNTVLIIIFEFIVKELCIRKIALNFQLSFVTEKLLSDFNVLKCLSTRVSPLHIHVFQHVFHHRKELTSVKVFVLKNVGPRRHVKMDVLFARMGGLSHTVKNVRISYSFFWYYYQIIWFCPAVHIPFIMLIKCYQVFLEISHFVYQNSATLYRYLMNKDFIL